jgi:hypothetical protein
VFLPNDAAVMPAQSSPWSVKAQGGKNTQQTPATHITNTMMVAMQNTLVVFALEAYQSMQAGKHFVNPPHHTTPLLGSIRATCLQRKFSMLSDQLSLHMLATSF